MHQLLAVGISGLLMDVRTTYVVPRGMIVRVLVVDCPYEYG